LIPNRIFTNDDLQQLQSKNFMNTGLKGEVMITGSLNISKIPNKRYKGEISLDQLQIHKEINSNKSKSQLIDQSYK
jgi:hypothetical protein